MDLGPPPSVVPVTPSPGVYPHPEYGSVDFSPETLQQLLANFQLYARPLPFRARHGSDIKLGWVTRLQPGPDGQLLGEVEWTPPGADAWAQGQVRMVSPEVHRDHEGVEGRRGPVLLGLAAADVPYFTPRYLQALFEDEHLAEVFGARVEVDAAPVFLLQEENWVASRGALELPIDEDDPEWDGAAAQQRIWELDPERWPDAHLAYNRAAPELHGSYKFPVADVEDGRLRVIPAGVRAARARVSSADLPADVKDAVNTISAALMARIQEALDMEELTPDITAAEPAPEPEEFAQSADSQTFDERVAAAKLELEEQYAERLQTLEKERDEALAQVQLAERARALQAFEDGLADLTFEGDRRFAPAALAAWRAFADRYPTIELADLAGLAQAAVTMPVGERTLTAVEAPASDPEARLTQRFSDGLSSGLSREDAWKQALATLSPEEHAQLFPDARAARGV